MFQKTTLKNGLRIITASIPSALSVGIWVFVKVGSRYENNKNAGISHFLEHMLLKATRKWPSQKELSFTVENNGAIFNGWTNKEYTCYFIKIPNEKINNGIELILDMVLYPKLGESDFEKEKGVITQEINRKYDNPDNYIWDLIDKTMWPNHPLGQFIIGSKETINNLKIKNLKDFFDKFYIPTNMVIAAGGNLKHQDFKKNVERFFDKKFSKRKQRLSCLPVKEKQNKSNVALNYKQTDQTHLLISIRAFHNNHPDKFVLNTINSLLGIGFSSRLMLNIRTKKGLAYTIYSRTEYFSDTGVLLINGGIGSEKVIPAIKEIVNELRRLKKELVKDDELHQAKEKLKGRFLFGIELSEDQAEWYVWQELFQPKVFTPEEILTKIDAVTPQDIKRVSNDLFKSQRLNLAIVGPHKDKTNLQEILKKID